MLRLQFDPLNLQQEEALAMVLYSRADTWLGWGETREVDRPLRSLGRIFQLALIGLRQTAATAFESRKTPQKRKLAASILPLILFAAFGAVWSVGLLPARAASIAGR